MEAFIAIAVAFGWAYYQISQNNPQQEPTENIKSVFSFFLNLNYWWINFDNYYFRNYFAFWLKMS